MASVWFAHRIVSTTSQNLTSNVAVQSQLTSFDYWLASLGITRTTGYRYRKQGLIHTTNIFGRLYVTRAEIENFERRAIAGEFYKEAKTPARRESIAA